MSVMSTLFPQNSNLLIAQAAATPNRVFSGTASTATSKVRRMEAKASASMTEEKYTFQPFSSACEKTASSGTRRKKARKASVAPMSMKRTHRGSAIARLAREDSLFEIYSRSLRTRLSSFNLCNAGKAIAGN